MEKNKAILQEVASNAQRSSAAILSFFFSRGAQYMPSVLNLPKAKTLSQLLYGAQLNPEIN
ncbi:hypothetical protein L345_07256, partial [Ophiophagus hannah]